MSGERLRDLCRWAWVRRAAAPVPMEVTKSEALLLQRHAGMKGRTRVPARRNPWPGPDDAGRGKNASLQHQPVGPALE
jgi:hypothetical protein